VEGVNRAIARPLKVLVPEGLGLEELDAPPGIGTARSAPGEAWALGHLDLR
jgi:hypothetical protein